MGILIFDIGFENNWKLNIKNNILKIQLHSQIKIKIRKIFKNFFDGFDKNVRKSLIY